MQLKRGRLVEASGAVLLMVAALSMPRHLARADSRARARSTVYFEQGGPLQMLVVTPGASADIDLFQNVQVQGGWEADVVSGASVAVVDSPSSAVDVISSATQLDDVRHTFRGGVTLSEEYTSLTVGYAYGSESDYRSHSLTAAAAAELFERNTRLEVSYARGFDEVCNLAQPQAQEAVDRQRLPSSDGCFEAEDRASLDLNLQTFQGAWTQAWTPVLSTQMTVTAQLLNGYQGNPYRAVWLGRSAAQENHPTHRTRYATGLAANWWLSPLRGAVQLSVRGYRDTWDIRSITAETGYEQALGEALRLRVRGRYYTQTGAVFYSDDYARMPQGQYFTGDRELSPMSSWTVGARLQWSVPSDDEGWVLGFLDSMDLVVKGDVILFQFPDFHYGQAAVPNDQAAVGTAAVQAVF